MSFYHVYPINWRHIFWRDRLWILSTIIVSLSLALLMLNLYPREYIAHTFITADYTDKTPTINWAHEAQHFISDALLKELENQRRPIQSKKSFDGFKPLKIENNAEPKTTPISPAKPNDLTQKIAVFVEYALDESTVGLRLETRSNNEAEAMMLARQTADTYIRLRHDHAIKKQAQDNAWIRAEVLKKQKNLNEAEALKTQYETEHKNILNGDQQTERRSALIEAETLLAQNKTRYGAKHPVMIELNARIKALTDEPSLDNNHYSLVKQTYDQLVNNVAIRELDLKQFLQKNGTGLSSAPQAKDRVVLRSGSITIEPDKSFDRGLILAFSALGFLLGLCLVMLKYKLYPTLQSAHDLSIELKSLAFTHLSISAKPSERRLAFKTWRRDIQLRFKDPKLLVLTSDHDHKEVTNTGYELACTAAQAGEKIMLIDMNWHAGQLQNLAHNEKRLSLVDYLTGSATLDAVLNRDDASGTHILFGSNVPMTAIDLIAGNKFANLLLSFRQIYDLVIMIAPPATPYADTKILSTLSDLTLLLAYRDSSENTSLITAHETLKDSKIDKIGLVYID